MKFGVLTKTALVVTLMMSQVTPQTASNTYYEDDSDFNKVVSVFSGGWGWGLNSAKAACDTYQDDATSADECIEVIGQEWPEIDPYDPYDYPDQDTGYTDSGNGGGSGPSEDSSSEPEFTPLQECNLEALEMKNDCYTIADGIYSASLTGCAYLGVLWGPAAGPVVAAACIAAASVAHTDAKGDCDEQYQKNLYICESTHS